MDAETATEFKNLNEKLDSALTTLYGCEKTGAPGMKIRVDRLEQTDKLRAVELEKAEASRNTKIKWLAGVVGVVVAERIKTWIGH